jgi:hypothetical protein
MSVASAVAIGPWALVITLVLMLGAALWVVGSVLARCLRAEHDRAVTVRVRLFGLLRVEVELGTAAEPAEPLPPREDTA